MTDLPIKALHKLVRADKMAVGIRQFISALGGTAVARPLAPRAGKRQKALAHARAFLSSPSEKALKRHQRHAPQDAEFCPASARSVEIDPERTYYGCLVNSTQDAIRASGACLR